MMSFVKVWFFFLRQSVMNSLNISNFIIFPFFFFSYLFQTSLFSIKLQVSLHFLILILLLYLQFDILLQVTSNEKLFLVQDYIHLYHLHYNFKFMPKNNLSSFQLKLFLFFHLYDCNFIFYS